MNPYLPILIILTSIHSAWAGNPAWVTDKLEVQMRSGPGTQYKASKTLSSGVELTVLDNTENNGYFHVTLAESGEEGWISARYISFTPVSKPQIEESTKKLTSLYEENKRLKSELAELHTTLENAEKSNRELASESSKMTSEVTSIRQASANVLLIQNERDHLTQEKVGLESQLDALQRENQALSSRNKQDWFLIGAGVLVLGILLGVYLPRISWRKKSSWDTF